MVLLELRFGTIGVPSSGPVTLNTNKKFVQEPQKLLHTVYGT